MRAVEQTELGALWPHLSPSAGSACSRGCCALYQVWPPSSRFHPQALQLPKFSLLFLLSKLRSLVPCCSLFPLPSYFCSLCLWSCALHFPSFLSALPRKVFEPLKVLLECLPVQCYLASHSDPIPSQSMAQSCLPWSKPGATSDGTWQCEF